MARVTVEDCVLKVPNRFELVLLAGQRAREISAGAPLAVDRDDDKNPVVALREIIEENETDETAVDEELEEDMLSIEEEEIDDAELPTGDEVENFEEEP